MAEQAMSGGGTGPIDYRQVFYAFDQGFCVLQVLLDEQGLPRDYRFIEVNHTFEELTGLTSPVGKTALELVPNLERSWIDVYGRVALTGGPIRFEQESPAMGRSFDVHASRIGDPEQRLVALLFTDITVHRTEQERRRRAEVALRASERQFRSFADTAPAMLWVTEADGSCAYLSGGWYRFTGQTEAEGLGYGWLDAVHPDGREATRELFLSANRKHEPFEFEHRLRRADGLYRWVLDAGRPRFDATGRFLGYVGSVIDIHDRKVTEARLDLAVNSGKVGLWYCDLPFDVLVWNRQVKEHFGLPADATVTIDTFYERMHPEDRELTRRAIDASIASQTPYDTQYRTVGLDGHIRWIRAIGRADYDDDGRPVRFDGITIDITELVSLREAAEAANHAKDEFLAMLGHELRNPLAPILTALQLMKLRGVTAAERERAIIERQVHHLVGLVDDLLDVSRITSGRIELRKERLDIADVVARAVEISSPLLEQQRHRLEVNVPRGLVVEGDPGRLAQVVANLLTNAAKYTESGGDIHIRGESSGNDVLLSVRDSGVGIAPDMLPRIFDLFVQERQSLARSQGGLGLGLAIVRGLVELHGGRVTVASRGKNQGAEFTVRLARAVPVHSADAPEVLSAPAVDGASEGRVLVVDDNRDAADLLCEMLRAIGYETQVAYDGPSAVEHAQWFEPHVALIDIGLPVMDGYEVAHRILQDPVLRSTSLVALTGYGQQRDREASARAGFSAHLVKPVDSDQLRAVIADLRGVSDESPAHRSGGS